MHYSVIVIVDKLGSAESDSDTLNAAVSAALEPYRDREWDWWQIGGRWTGHFDGYDPAKDPANTETCDLCGGTGDRASWRHEPKEQQHESGCNGCYGKGQRVKWPTNFVEHEGDILPVEQLTAAHIDVHAIVTDSDWNGGEKYIPWTTENGNGDSHFLQLPKPPLAWLHESQAGKLAVIVDCHN